jgi:disulfide bond formation protein DsbB
MMLVLVAVLLALHVLSSSSRIVSYAVAAASLLVLWLGVKQTSMSVSRVRAGTGHVRALKASTRGSQRQPHRGPDCPLVRFSEVSLLAATHLAVISPDSPANSP